uniref:Transposase (putative) gypsy type domain-containing protein n=1 Tax=Cajanus cajan TaxID=3821 RepID=A0A151QUK5_CAJCA|nr:hypothetical protein KK1_045076 [Cajanus cajan]
MFLSGLSPFFYMYRCLFKDLGVSVPFNPFECSFLSHVNVAPSQLHLNSWGFLRAFQVLCSVLGIEVLLAKFIHFYQLKLGDPPLGWLFLSGSKEGGLFSLFFLSYKNFKKDYFKNCPINTDVASEHLFHLNGDPKFPLYWQQNLIRFAGSIGFALSAVDEEDIEKLQSLPRPLDSRSVLSLPSSANLVIIAEVGHGGFSSVVLPMMGSFLPWCVFGFQVGAHSFSMV